jgi:hypothetical protein
MSLPQILKRLSQILWLKGIVISLLMLGLVLSLSPAIAQVSSSSDHQISLFKTFQQWLLDNPFVGFGVVVSGISFLIGFILSLLLSLQPVFILPISKKISIDDHDLGVKKILSISSFSLSCSFGIWILNLDIVGAKDLLSLWPNWIPFWISLLCVSMTYFWGFMYLWRGIYFIEIVLIKFLTRSKRISFRPFSCIYCRKKLTMLTCPSNFLNHQEKIAMNIKSTTFEAWHCQSCYPEINSQSIHLRIYRDMSNYFGRCSVCKEVTMTKNSSRIVEVATSKQEGKK